MDKFLFKPHRRSKRAPRPMKASAGFTIIELIVVIAIAALILAGVSVLLSNTKAKTRDAQREQHIKTLQNALTLYATNSQRYPVYTGYITGTDALTTALKNNSALNEVPSDPINSGDYRYYYTSSNGSTYILTYYLETDTVPGKRAGLQTVGP